MSDLPHEYAKIYEWFCDTLDFTNIKFGIDEVCTLGLTHIPTGSKLQMKLPGIARVILHHL